jgi:predicted dehydrogenase/threonine dehydrogenase-like Zn-dependent dehydrogenase
MHQVLQTARDGRTALVEVPVPALGAGHILIANVASVISAGTEKMVIDLARKSLLGKARERPDQVRRLWDKARQEGLGSALRAARARLDEPITMGYASSGIVLEAGDGVQEFKPGDRVASNGPHAGVVCVPKNLCARVPDNVSFEHAAFTVLGAIALNGVRLSRATLGETVFVIGLGLVGQLAVALLKAAGCRVIGTDLDTSKCDLAIKMGATLARPGLAASHIEAVTGGLGADAVVITASTQSNGPIELAAAAVRKKGRVVLVGVVGLALDRRPFYFKEAEFVVSCSYGPGRYDPAYEEGGHDYPAAYVRWTEQRNMEAVLNLMASGGLDVSALITHRFPVEQAERAYALIERGAEPYLGIVLQYPHEEREKLQRQIALPVHTATKPAQAKIGIAVLGVGNFARTTLLPELKKCEGFRPVTLCSASGLSSSHYGPRFGFAVASSDEKQTIRRDDVDAVFILTRHHQHAEQIIAALNADKHVFCEKPLCLSEDELRNIVRTHGAKSQCIVTVGYNRRFAAMARQLKNFFADAHEPLVMHYRVNAGYITPDHWVHDPEQGGGRIIGEVCHFVDFMMFLTGAAPARVSAHTLPNNQRYRDDNVVVTLTFPDGSSGTITYVANGDKGFSKERVEVFGGGAVAVLDDFRRLELLRGGRKQVVKSRWRQDKGHRGELEAFLAAARNGTSPPIPFRDIVAVSLTTFAIIESLRRGETVDVDTDGFIEAARASDKAGSAEQGARS